MGDWRLYSRKMAKDYVAITEASYFSPFLGKCSLECCLTDSLNMQKDSYLRPNMNSVLSSHHRHDILFKAGPGKCIEHNIPFYINCVNFTEALDTVNQNTLWRVPSKVATLNCL